MNIYKEVDGRTHVETTPGIFESKKHGVLHTHAHLRRLGERYAAKSAKTNSSLRFWHIISDGGRTHFNLADNFRHCQHLQEEMRHHDGVSEVLTLYWDLLQSNHGKGPYDAEGGIIKYYVRNFIRGGGVLTNSEQVYDHCKEHLEKQLHRSDPARSVDVDLGRPYSIDGAHTCSHSTFLYLHLLLT